MTTLARVLCLCLVFATTLTAAPVPVRKEKPKPALPVGTFRCDGNSGMWSYWTITFDKEGGVADVSGNYTYKGYWTHRNNGCVYWSEKFGDRSFRAEGVATEDGFVGEFWADQQYVTSTPLKIVWRKLK